MARFKDLYLGRNSSIFMCDHSPKYLKKMALKQSLRDKQAAIAAAVDNSAPEDYGEDSGPNENVDSASEDRIGEVGSNQVLNSTYTKSPVNTAAQV